MSGNSQHGLSVLVLTRLFNHISYYRPWLAAHGSALNVASNVASIAARDLHELGYHAAASRDRGLVAMAQLATLRLNVRRAMVSLIDTDHQYILAEATKTVSLMSDARHGSDDQLWLGTAILNREEAVCHHCFTNTYRAKDSATEIDGPGDERALVVNDCRLDDRFKDRSYVVAEPGVRFYAGVPIVTREGHAIGVYAVSDDLPRDGLSLEELRFMQDIAAAVLEHLEWAKDRVDRFKGERIVHGLATFIDGSAATPDSDATALVEHFEGAEGGDHSVGDDHDHTGRDADQQNHQTRPPSRDKEGTLMPPRDRSDSSDLASDTESVHSAAPSGHSFSRSRKRKRDVTEGDNITSILNRAAHILRESTLADGVIFFSASEAPADEQSSPPNGSNSRETRDPEGKQENYTPVSRVLGASLGQRHDDQSSISNPLSVATLKAYFEAYPEGKTFYFTDRGTGLGSGEGSSGDDHDSSQVFLPPDRNDEVKASPAAWKRKAQISHAEILEKLPGVQSVVFFPLRDILSDKWLAGGFLWASNADRMMSLDDNVSYLKAFGNSICSEVARANVEQLDRAKTTFIASMSHELRSPLHGILGSVEFLQDTITDSYQSGLVTSISNCSRTLLDTLSNLLSYAKVTTMQDANATVEVDLGKLVEEVVEAVCAGHTFKKLHSTGLASEQDDSLATALHREAKSSAGKLHYDDDAEDSSSAPGAAVSVLLDIAPSVSWNVSINPGALRRIIMNLVGNALKYTSKGFVGVSLRGTQNKDKISATLRVADSGKGISPEFQRDHLFSPFKQEDPFASGTGLGLSIVRQLIDTLGGEIRIKSAVNHGTEIEVSLEFQQAAHSGIEMPDDEITSVVAKTKDMRLCVLDPNEEKQKPEKDHIARLDTALSELCSTWFGMEITKTDKLTRANADLFLYTEPPSLEYLLEHHSGENGERLKPLIIVCMNASEAISISKKQIKELNKLGNVVEVVPQPCGPRKLAKILGHCLQRVEELQQGKKRGKASGQEAEVDHEEKLGATQSDVHQDSDSQATARILSLNEQGGSKQDEAELLAKYRSEPAKLSLAVTRAGPETAASPQNPGHLPDRSKGVAPQSAPGDTQGHRALHVLIVDDSKINVDLMVKFVQKFRLTSDQACNGQEAVDKFKAAHEKVNDNGHGNDKGKRYDTILMDISMPVMDGVEATRRIREFEEQAGLERTQIIALSAFTSLDTQQKAKSNGVDIYLPKPVKFAQLKELLLGK